MTKWTEHSNGTITVPTSEELPDGSIIDGFKEIGPDDAAYEWWKETIRLAKQERRVASSGNEGAQR